MPYISQAQLDELGAICDRMLAAHVVARASLTEGLAGLRIALGQAPAADRQGARFRLRDFLNVVAILDSIDHDDLPTIRWADWRRDPAEYLRQADDGTQRAIWSLVEQRLDKQPKEG